MADNYRTDYPTKPIGGDNPYYQCAECGVSEPEINGAVENHREWCAWRLKVESDDELTTAKQLLENVVLLHKGAYTERDKYMLISDIEKFLSGEKE